MNNLFPRYFGNLRESIGGSGARGYIGGGLVIVGSLIFAAGASWAHVVGYAGMGIVLVGALIAPAPFRFGPESRSLLVLMLILFLWGGVLSIFVAVRPGQGFLALFAYFAHWTLPFLAGIWGVRRLGPKISNLWLLSLFILGFVSLLAFLGVFDAPRLSREGMLVGTHNHIQFAALLFLGLSLVYGLFLSPGNSVKKSTILAAAGVFLLLYFLLAGSRGWWIAAAVSLTGMTIHHIVKNRARKTALLMIAAGILLVVIAIAASPQIRARFGATGLNDPNLIYRRNMAVMAGEIIRDHPVVGIGPGQTPYVKQYYDRMQKANIPQETGYLQKKHFHDIYLQMAAEFGLPGLVIFLMILLGIFRILRKAAKADSGGYNTGLIYGTLWAWVAFAIAEFFDCLLRGPAVAMEYFWVLGICAGLNNIAGDNIPKKSQLKEV